MIEVRYSPRALRDVLDCAIWWTTHHAQSVSAFDDELERTLAFIKQFPEASPQGELRRYGWRAMRYR